VTVSADYWKCPICQDVLDGDTNGLVSLSKRCYHVFHKVCIERWLQQGSRTCPTCNLNHFSSREIILNPEHTQQYRRWHADPNNYSYEQAFQEEYGRSSQDVGIAPENILRPVELRDLPRRGQLTPEEISHFHREMNEAVQALGADATPEQVEKARREIAEAREMALDSLQEQSRRQDERLRDNGERLAVQGEKLSHQHLLSAYYKKVDTLEKKIINKFRDFTDLSEEERSEEIKGFIKQLNKVYYSLVQFNKSFTQSGRTNERSIEESQELLKQVETELDEFLASQPEHIKEILEAPLPTKPAASSSSSAAAAVPPPPAPFVPGTENNPPPERPWKGIIGVILGIFALAIGLGYQFRDQLYRRFWNGRLITHQLEM